MKALILPTNNESLLSTGSEKTRFVLNSNLRSLLRDQIESLINAGVDELLMIRGIVDDGLSDFLINSDDIRIRIKIIRNPFQFQSASSLVALWMAISEINEDVLIINTQSLLRKGLLELFIKYEGGSTSCFVVSKDSRYEYGDHKILNQNYDISGFGDNQYLKQHIFSDSISLCSFRQSGLNSIKESIEEEIRTEDSNKKEFVSAVYRLIRNEHLVCKIKSFDICDIYKIYTNSQDNTLKAAVNSSGRLEKSHRHRNLRIVNTRTE